MIAKLEMTQRTTQQNADPNRITTLVRSIYRDIQWFCCWLALFTCVFVLQNNKRKFALIHTNSRQRWMLVWFRCEHYYNTESRKHQGALCFLCWRRSMSGVGYRGLKLIYHCIYCAPTPAPTWRSQEASEQGNIFCSINTKIKITGDRNWNAISCNYRWIKE